MTCYLLLIYDRMDSSHRGGQYSENFLSTLQVLDTKTESAEVSTSLATLSTFYSENSTSTRRRLRSTIENETVKIYEDFLGAASSLSGSLNGLQKLLDSTTQKCNDMANMTSETRTLTSNLLSETRKLEEALDVSRARFAMVEEFQDKYQLSPEEAETLKGDMSEDFFKALQHVVAIHGNCKALLRTHHQRAGLELLESMASLQDTAYERVCRWVREEGRKAVEQDMPEVDPLLHQAAQALRARPILRSYCAEEIASARQSSNFQRFIRALTRGSRPIEMHAPDPWRYASDMLAWVHTSLASERDFFVALFGNDDTDTSEALPMDSCNLDTKAENDAKMEPLIPRILDIVFQSIARPLKVRLEQVLLTSPPPLLCFRLSQLLAFHIRTFDSILFDANQLSDALRSCRSMAMRIFHDTIKYRCDKLIRYPPTPPPDLSLPLQIAELVDLVSDLIDNYESSLTSGDNGMLESDQFDDVLDLVLDPLVVAVEKSSEALDPKATGRVDTGEHLNPSDQNVYILNCLHELQFPLEGHVCASRTVEKLKLAAASHMKALAASEVERTLSYCNLMDITQEFERIESLRANGEEVNLVSNTLLTLPRISTAMRTFFGILSDPGSLPEFRKLRAPHMKSEAINSSHSALADAYARVYDGLMDPRNGFDVSNVMAEIKHTPKQVRTLLGVQVM